MRDRLTFMGWGELVVFNIPACDNSIIGVAEGGRVVYNYDLMVSEVKSDLNITEEEAMEFIDRNVAECQAHSCELFPPIIIYPIPKEGEKF